MTASFDPPLVHAPVSWLNGRTAFIALMLTMLALLPVYTTLSGDSFVMTLFTRVLILAIGAVSLNLIMGYGGMMSFGHAAYLGIGGYAVGILAAEGIGSIRGAFVASLIVGLIDTIGRAFLPDMLHLALSTNAAATLGPALSSMSIYMLMAAILVFRPEGLFPAASR